MMHGRRADSPNWEARIRLPDGRVVTRSTGEQSLVDAQRVAWELYLQLREDVAIGRGISTRSFKQVAEDLLKNLEEQAKLLRANSPHGRSHHKIHKHVTCIRNSLIPVFGDLPITGLTEEVLATYVRARKGRNEVQAASASTIRNHNHSLQKVFAHAKGKGWIKDVDARTLPAGDARVEPRATFESREFRTLVAFMTDAWVAAGRTRITRETRAILREYVLIAAATGIRPGTELDYLPWSAVDLDWKDEFDRGPHIVIRVSRHRGKTARGRSVIAYQGEERAVRDAFARLHSLNPSASPDTPIFARPSDQTVPKDLHGAFEACLSDPALNLLRDRDGDRRAPYSLRHFYACQMLLRGCSYETLEKQMGTSAKMLSDFYSSRVTPLVRADELGGRAAETARARLFTTSLGADESELRGRLVLAEQGGPGLALGKDGQIKLVAQSR